MKNPTKDPIEHEDTACPTVESNHLKVMRAFNDSKETTQQKTETSMKKRSEPLLF